MRRAAQAAAAPGACRASARAPRARPIRPARPSRPAARARRAAAPRQARRRVRRRAKRRAAKERSKFWFSSVLPRRDPGPLAWEYSECCAKGGRRVNGALGGYRSAPCGTLQHHRNREAVISEYERLLLRSVLDCLCDEAVVRRELAYRVRVRGITCQQIGLTAAAAEIANLLRTAPAGFLHPGVAGEAIERGRLVPDRADTRVAHAGKGRPRQHARGMARQSDAVGRYRHENRSEPVHARFGAPLVVVGD